MLTMDPDIEKYILDHSDPECQLLAELTRQTFLKTVFPRMLSGHLQGAFLNMICKMIAPVTALEIGTFTGYSAICIARGLSNTGILHTIEINDEMAEMAQSFFNRAGLHEKIKQHIGNALDIIPTLQENFDLVFIDGDKRQYPDYYSCVFELVKPGGFILADNVLWSGKVIEPRQKNDEYTKGIVCFNDIVQKDTRVENTILPIRDGIMLVRKK